MMLSELTLFTTFAVHHLIIGAGLLAVLWVLTAIFKSSAELQSWLWSAAFVTSALIPFAAMIPDAPQEEKVFPFTEQTDTAMTAGEKLIASTQPSEISEQPQWNVPGRFVYDITDVLYWFLAIWLAGSLWRAVSVAKAFRSTRKLISSASPIPKNSLSELTENIPVLSSTSATTPMAVGLLKPVILLPQSLLEQFDLRQIAPVVLHELAHIQRRDLWISLFQEMIAIVFWWSPVVRILNRRIHITRELACDIRAANRLSAGQHYSGKQYAQSLLDCTKLMLSERRNVLALGLFSKKKDLTYRVNEVLKSKNSKTPKLLTTVVACITFSAAAVSVAHNYAPKINLRTIDFEANHFSKLTRDQSELLIEVIESGDQTSLLTMIESGLDVDTPVVGDGTALIVAVKRNNREMVEALLEYGADVNQSALGDGNPLIAAASTNNVELAEFLQRQGADINAIVVGDETALITASGEGHIEMVKHLVENGADINLGVNAETFKGKEYRTPLNRAANADIRSYLQGMGAKD